MFLLRLFLLPFRTLFALPKIIFGLLLVLSLCFNIATLTVSGVYFAASSALSSIGVATVAAREAGERLALRQSLSRKEAAAAKQAKRHLALRQIGSQTAERAKRRVQRSAARNISSAAGEALPFVGIGVVIGALTLEVRDACDTARDMAGFTAALETQGKPEEARQFAVDNFDCVQMIREEIPDYEDLPTKAEIWETVVATPGYAWESAKAAGLELSEYDWSGAPTRVWSGIMSGVESSVDWLFGGDEP